MKKKLLTIFLLLTVVYLGYSTYLYIGRCLCEDLWFPKNCYCSDYPITEGYN